MYENAKTGERQAWFPEQEAVDTGLPEGWRKVESRTYPGKFVYENEHTRERQAWAPTAAGASCVPILGNACHRRLSLPYVRCRRR